MLQASDTRKDFDKLIEGERPVAVESSVTPAFCLQVSSAQDILCCSSEVLQ